MNKLDKTYTALLQDILDNGVTKQDRTGTGTISVFGRQIRHKMSEGFPLLTTKRMPFKTIVTELLWFLRGDTNIKYLVDNNCHIWDGDAYKNYRNNCKPERGNEPDWMQPEIDFQYLTQEEFINKIKTDDDFAEKWGELGPIYGKQWRDWDTSSIAEKAGWIQNGTSISDFKIDQIQNLINDLKTNPDSRRLMVNAWAVHDLPNMVLPPCHYGFQVYTRELSLRERVDIFNLKMIKEEIRTRIATVGVDESYWKKSLEKTKHNIPTRAISLMWNQRSVDTFLGLPFNIASYGLLLEIIAKEVNMVPEELIGNLGDVHLYSNHIEQAKEQIGRELTLDERGEIFNQRGYKADLFPFNGDWKGEYNSFNIPTRTREPFPLPTLKFNPCPITGISMEYQSIAQFKIENYQSHPAIKAPLSN